MVPSFAKAASIDVAILGAGLSGGLLALRLRALRPDLKTVIFEKLEPGEAAPKTWSFHESDVSGPAAQWLSPLLSGSWNGYSVLFPNLSRDFHGGYFSIRSKTLASELTSQLGEDLIHGARVTEHGSGWLQLAGGQRFDVGCVVDARGAESRSESESSAVGFQKFLGLDLELSSPHGLDRPVLFDASVEQIDGFRFVYVLPWSATELLIEDTYYSDSAEIDRPALKSRILVYAREKGWTIKNISREESGCLPIPFTEAAQFAARPADPDLALTTIGTKSGFYHATTGYSLPFAARLAEEIASLPKIDAKSVSAVVSRFDLDFRKRQSFYRLLNRMLFRAARPSERWRVLARFCRLSQPLVDRFYSGQTSLADRARILVGKPPVPVRRALSCLRENVSSAS